MPFSHNRKACFIKNNAILTTNKRVGSRAVKVGPAVLWTVGGLGFYTSSCKIITITPATLTLQRAIFGRGRRSTYDLAQIQQLRVTPNGALAFNHGAQTVTFGRGVPLTEALLILHTLTAHLPALTSTATAA